MKLLPRRLSFRWTIGRRIALAFVVMGSITTILATYTIVGTKGAGDLVIEMFDKYVVTTNFARASVADFDRMRAEFAETRNVKSATMATLHRSFRADLATAMENIPTTAMSDLGEGLRRSEQEWLTKAKDLQARGSIIARDLADLDTIARNVESQVDGLVNLVGDAAFEGRQGATHTVTRNATLAIAGSLIGVTMLGLAGLLLHRRIRVPLDLVVNFAREIAGGNLDGETPKADSDEIGDLTRAMTSMRSDIKRMVDEQTVLRKSAHARVEEALDSSGEGVVVADAAGLIQIINARALDFLGLGGRPLPTGTTLDGLRRLVGPNDHARQALLAAVTEETETRETELPDGRQIQNSRSRTSEGGFVGFYTDVTSILDQKKSLVAAKATLDAALANMSQGLCLFDADNCLKLVNPQCLTLLRLNPAAVTVGTKYTDLLDMSIAAGNHPTIEPDRLRRHERWTLGRRRRTTRFINFAHGRIIANTHEPMTDGGWLATYEDVTERRQVEDRISHLANHDALTGLPNRTMLATRVNEALSRAAGGTGFAMLCLDLDHFKEINDVLGHVAGDALLEIVAQRLRGCVGRFDTVARLGGDEFAVLQANVTDRQQAEVLAGRIVEALGTPFDIDGSSQAIGSSIGIAMAPQDGADYGQLLKHADVALYKAKDDGRATWRFFSESMDEELKARRAMEIDLKRALQAGELELRYQPLLDVASMGIGGFEALIRWMHPVNGMVAPSDFIPVAEEIGLINAIGEWVLNRACQQAMTWSDTIKIAVNVSIVQLRDRRFVEIVEQALAASGLSPRRLELEITESVFMTNNAKAMENLKALKALGICFAMDDFGTGYSSLSYLTKFAFDKIKIDRSFLRNLFDSDEAGQIVRTIVALGNNLGMRVTAEGVETLKQLKMLEGIGCHEIQGYLIGRPMTADLIEDMLTSHNGSNTLGQQAA